MGYFRPLKNASSFRKLAAAMWKPANDPQIFGSLDIDMTDALALLEAYNSRFGCKVTVTHLVVRAVAMLLGRHPEMNAKVGWSQIWLRPQVDIFCQVATDSGRDLSGLKIDRADNLSLAQLVQRLAGGAAAIRSDADPAFRRSRSMLQGLPLWGVRFIVKLMSFLSNTLNLHLPKLGMPRDPFGSAMVTSVGGFGIDTGFAPLTPVARCPLIIAVMQVRSRPWVVEERVVPRPVLRLCGTFDHRVIDGYHAGQLSAGMRALLCEPWQMLTESERAQLPAGVAGAKPPEKSSVLAS